ncbi:unnamed protein product, partial [Mesorhabditis belari]|uniref:Uncharacterized protein n=1 Tax=Mesorhabditis belari TaxID=2138241 RepID=A0AAF3FPN7_9BILA
MCCPTSCSTRSFGDYGGSFLTGGKRVAGKMTWIDGTPLDYEQTICEDSRDSDILMIGDATCTACGPIEEGNWNIVSTVNIYIGIFGEFDANDFRFAFTKVLGECPDFRSLPPNAHGTMTADNEAAREEARFILQMHQIECGPGHEFLLCIPDSAANDLTPRPIPEGFTLGPLRAEDVDFVLHHWPYAASDEAEALKSQSQSDLLSISKLYIFDFRYRLSRLASAALIDKRTNLPACFLFLEHNGMLTSMYTVEQYRGRKFQDIVFTDVLAQCHSMGVHPWLGISPSNKPLLTMTPDVMKVRTPTGGHQKAFMFFTKLGSAHLKQSPIVLQGNKL